MSFNSFELGRDGSLDNCLPIPSKTFITAYVKELAEKEGDFETTLPESDEEFDDMTKGMPRKTRKEQKAQEKELSWREIMQQSDDYVQTFVEATIKETSSFTTWKSLQPFRVRCQVEEAHHHLQRMLQGQEQKRSTTQGQNQDCLSWQPRS